MTDSIEFLERHPKIPGYEPLRLEGQNGGTVYLARQLSTDKLVWLRVDGRNGDHCYSSFLALSLLDHPNISQVFEIGEVHGCHFYALEYTDRSLEDLLKDGPISEVDAVSLAHAVTAALVYAERRYLEAVALSPTSIQIAEGDTPKLANFRSVAVPGVTEFTSPDEVVNPFPHVPSVIYRIGATLYAMLTGEPPVSFKDGNSISENAFAIVNGTSKAIEQCVPTISSDLRMLVSRCLGKMPDERYQSIPDVANALRELIKKGSV